MSNSWTTLDPCPFCKSTAVDVVSRNGAKAPLGFVFNENGYKHHQPFKVLCQSCRARGPLASAPANAIFGWNQANLLEMKG